MTEKLYYTDPYLKEFEAEILSVTPLNEGFDVVLNKTAFFPEEGGQSADTGYIGSAKVLDAYEKDGVVHHLTDTHPGEAPVLCKLDFDTRFEKMQCHTAEHILCGIIHRLYGFENVGFHLGDDLVTFDVGGVLTAEQIDRVERLANEAVFANMKVEAFFPTAEELSAVEYRSKLNLTSGVRLVKIGDVDVCACCAPHVSQTGEIGMIKITDFMKHRGGTRFFMVAGRRAYLDYCERHNNVKRISAMLSAPQLETAAVLEDYMKDSDSTRSALKQARIKLAESYAAATESTEDSVVYLFPDFTISELIAFSNEASKKVGGILVALSGEEGNYKYVISSNDDLSSRVKEINSALSGRGGGRGNMIQGSFGAGLDEIKSFFLSKD